MISVEVEKPGREGLEKLAEVAHVVFYSKSWAWVSSSTIEDWTLTKSLCCRPKVTTTQSPSSKN